MATLSKRQKAVKGKIDGNNLSFIVSMQGPNGAMTRNYKGVVNGDEMTLTMKLKRRPISDKYADEIEELYAAELAASVHEA